MYKTMMLSLNELLYKMRNMEVGEEIGLAATSSGEYSYGIRRLPGEMFDNGMCWLADYYGGGSTTAFSETEDEYEQEPGQLYEKVEDWLGESGLIWEARDEGFEGHVFVQIKDGSLPDTKWKFKKVDIPAKNRIACVNFDLKRPYRAYISVPYDASDEEIKKIFVKTLMGLSPEEFGSHIISCEDDCEPFVDEGDVTWMEVDTQYIKNTTDELPGTLIL